MAFNDQAYGPGGQYGTGGTKARQAAAKARGITKTPATGWGKWPGTPDIAKLSYKTTPTVTGPGFQIRSQWDPKTKRFVQKFAETGHAKERTADRDRIAAELGVAGKGLAGGLEGGREAYEKATFDRAMALLSPQLESREAGIRDTLVNTGNPIGGARAAAEMDMMARDRSTQTNDLALASVLAGQQGRAMDQEQIGNIFNILSADKPQYFQQGALMSPETVLQRYIAKNQPKPAKKKGGGALGALGGVAGGVIGGMVGGPAGAAVGASVGGAAGGAMES